ncbi:DUF2147 domain-containing protein [Ekhidna sp.]|jgi:hypothetical protein|uniref:DUF2147 domain-containing protein n=1 Tax=Ekhidna sp. TaxID=2608089 RepID=UPI003B5B43BD
MRIKLNSILLFFQIGLTINVIAQKGPDSIVGNWVSSDGVRTVRVYKEKDKYKADIIKSNNPEETGKLILWNLVYDLESREWNDGKIQLPGMSHEVDCFIEMNKKDTMKITGYHGWRIFGSSEVYIKEL